MTPSSMIFAPACTLTHLNTYTLHRIKFNEEDRARLRKALLIEYEE